jgi:PDZ domain of MCC-2 bdg protein for Usher syndrome
MEATNPQPIHRIESDTEDHTAEPYQRPCDDLNTNYKFKSASPCTLPPPGFSTQMQALQEEIFHLRAQVALLQSQLASCSRDEENLLMTATGHQYAYDEEQLDEEEADGDDEKSNHTSDDLCETADIFEITNERRGDAKDSTNEPGDDDVGAVVQDGDFLRQTKAHSRRTNNVSLPLSKGSTPKNQPPQKTSSTEQPITKMAERVKLRRTVEEMQVNDSNFMTTGIHTTEIAEHLVSDFLQSSESAATTIPTLTTNSSADHCQQLQKEVQRQQRRLEHLRLQNSVLNLTLTETKQHCNLLYLLCGKYESNAIALQQALNCSDRSIEAYDVMLALLESKLGLMETTPSAQESRKAAESVARHLLNRLECESNLEDNSLGPWQNAIVINPNVETEKWCDDDDLSLRNHVSKLKGLRSSIQNTVVTLESPFSVDDSQNEEITSTTNKSRSKQDRRMDLETAVLMQELMSMREDVSELKYAKEQAEHEKAVAQQKLQALQEALVHLQAQLAESEVLLQLATKDRTSFSEAEHTVGIERELVEALARESRLKGRLQALAGSLEAAARSSEERHTQVQSTVAELKTTNL